MLDALPHKAHSNVSGFTLKSASRSRFDVGHPDLGQRRNRCSETVDWAGRREPLCELQCYLGAPIDVIFDILQFRQSTEGTMSIECSHEKAIRNVTPSARGCEECLKTGSKWVHLRLCRTCGHVGCCDDSPNRHATKHFHATAHPIIEG